MGTGGIITPPEGYWEEIQKVLAKYDVLGGAACSLASQRYDYPYQYCAPKAYPPSVAGSILGIYSQYGIVVDPSRVQVGSITPAAPNAKGKSKGKSGRARTKAESGTSARKPKTNGAGKAKTTQRASSPSTTLSTGAIGNQLKLAISRL